MASSFQHFASIALIGTGCFVGAWAAQGLCKDATLKGPVNVLGVNRSPYGEVFAIAMQGPITTFFDQGGAKVQAKEKPKTAFSYAAVIEQLNHAAVERTVATRPSKSYSFYIRRSVEDKLKFAYQLDPANYTNFNAYHFFLTEPALGTRPILTKEAALLADDTIRYCLQQNNDPRDAITAAGAAGNLLLLMFADYHSEKPTFTIAQMQEKLRVMDHCIARYQELSDQWESTKNWNLLSDARIFECQERITFICKLRDSAAVTISRLRDNSQASPARESHSATGNSPPSLPSNS